MEISDILSSLSESDIENLKSVAADLFSSDDDNADNPLANADFSALGALLQPKDDDRVALIRALKPMLSDERKQRADEAIRLMRLASLLPTLQQSGILENLFGGENGLL